MSTDLRLELILRTYPEGDRWTWRLTRHGQIRSSSGPQLYSRRVDCARGAEEGTGVSGVYDALVNVTSKGGGTAKRLAFRRLDGVTVRIVDERGGA